jgi:formylglycine-generating enzyme
MSEAAPAPSGIDMVSIPAGRVLLSDRRLQRRWQVDLPPYQLAAVPVTAELFARIGETGGHGPPAAASARPVVNVSWRDTVRFCNALSASEGMQPPYTLGADGETVTWQRDADGYRLPTEAEWEHACRAGTTGPRYGPLDEIAWHRGNSDGRLREVAGRRANPWGLHDMLGNSWDWCWDVYDPEVYGTYRVLRGGGWFDEQWSCRASVRRRSHPDFRVDDVGFRLARTVR